MTTGKTLKFSNLRKTVSKRAEEIVEKRQAGKIKYSLHDSCLSALAMMFFQDPSMLEFQRRLEEASQLNNLQTMFNVMTIPKDNQMRTILDNVPPEKLYPVFSDFFRLLQRGNHLNDYLFLEDGYIIPIDGTQYFRSERVNCPSCLMKKHRNGTTSYSHQALGAAVVHPDKPQVFPLAPEPIKNTDGIKKQDCEINAGKRILQRIRTDYPNLKIVITADDLYSKKPFVELLKKLKPVLDELKKWLDATVEITPPQSLLGKAVNYALNQWHHLVIYADTAHVTSDNNMAENTIRPL